MLALWREQVTQDDVAFEHAAVNGDVVIERDGTRAEYSGVLLDRIDARLPSGVASVATFFASHISSTGT